jgi:cytochrome c oxidase subunit IV
MSNHSHNESNAQQYYEGDQSKLYSGIMNHHYGHDVKSSDSKKQIGRIWKVFWILLVVTVIEVILGMFFSHHMPEGLVAFFFLTLTLLKAGYIVAVFMHLGDELRNFLITIMIPLVLFIWFIIAFLADGGFWLHMNQTSPTNDNTRIEAVR